MEIIYRFAPEVLEEQEAAARQARFLTLTTRADGTVALRGLLDKEAGALAMAVLGPLAAPIPAADGIPDPRDTGARYADAFIQLCQLATPDLPQVRGERPNVVSHRQLGEPAGESRRLRAGDARQRHPALH